MPGKMAGNTTTPWRARRDEVDQRWVRSLCAGDSRQGVPEVVIVPGLGALGYLLDTLAGCGSWTRSFLLDLPGFSLRGQQTCPAEIPALAALVSAWVNTVPAGPIVLVGHSTGAQVALRAALREPGKVAALALFGPTFPPAERTFPGLFRAFARTSRREPIGELRATVPYYARAGVGELRRFLRSAQQDRPEDLIPRVSCPVLLARGEHDAFSPQHWVEELAASARHAQSVTVPGAHAFPFRQGGLTATLIARAARIGAEKPFHDAGRLDDAPVG